MQVQDFCKEFFSQIERAQDVLIGTHLNPDGDALGSALAIMHLLDEIGVKNEVICNNLAPYNLQFLPGADRVKLKPERSGHDLGIVLDLDNFDRLGRTREHFEDIPDIILIDHHVPHEGPGSLRIVDSSAPATALIINRLLEQSKSEITPEIALCLLTGIVTDTGSFRYGNTTPEALHASANLLAKGGDIVLVCEEVYGKKPLQSIELAGRMLSKLQLDMDHRIAWAVLNSQDFEEFGGTEVHTEGLINEMLAISTVKVAALVRQPSGGRVRASLRSRDPIDVSEVARVFGGGGHKNAAGCTFDTDIDHAEMMLVEELRRCLES